VACGSLDANLDEVGYRGHGHRWGYRFFYGSLEAIDREKRHVVVAPICDEDGTELVGRHAIRYDYLVLAVGAISNDFGTPGVRDNCIVLDDRKDADRFRQKLLNHCLRVSRAVASDSSADAKVEVAIVGGGATGVELAAELFNAADGLRHYGLEIFDDSRLKVTLVEAGPRLLKALPEKLAESVRKELQALGVRVMVSTAIAQVGIGTMTTSAGEVIRADLLVWAAGVKASPLLRDIAGLETTASDQLVVRSTLQTTRDDRIFAIGDCCFFKPEGTDRPAPPRAQAARQMAITVYRNILALVAGKPLGEFSYRDRGSLISLSRFSTVGSLMGNLVGGRMAIEGRLARLVYVSLYHLHLVGIHGRLGGLALILVGHVNRIIRPRLKLH
jgi:NADH dehydrogenase